MQLILSGKICPAPQGDSILPRTRLLESLMAAQQKLILLQSPAGYGKSILLSHWFHERAKKGLPTAWLSLDPGDANTQTVLTYIVNALQETGLELGSLLNLMSNPLGVVTSEEIVLTLCSTLEKRSENTVLILEDLHCVESSEIDHLLEILIKRSPANFQLALSSREFPSLSISKLRAQENLLQLTSHDLQFTETEICEFLRIDTTEDELRSITTISEGWAFALQLIRLHRRDGRNIVKTLVELGSLREDVADYLASQVLETLPESCQDFLIDTAFLDQISSSLSDSILGREDSAEIFEELRSLNGLLDPIDEEHVWYRHHSLLTDYLRRLLQRKGDAYAKALHKRAYRWFEDNQRNFDAIKYAVRVGDSEKVAILFEKIGGPNIGWKQGFEPLQRILTTIPDEWIEKHSSLKIGQAMIHANDGDIVQAKKILNEVKNQFGDITDSNYLHYSNTLRLILVGYVTYHDLDAEIEATEQAGVEAPSSDIWFQGWVYSSLWLLYFRQGLFSAARIAALTAIEKLGKAKAFYSENHANLDLGIICMARGRLNDSLKYYQRADYLTRQHFPESASMTRVTQLLTADVHFQRNELDKAYELFDLASDQLAHLLVQSEVCINCYMAAANIIFSRDGLDPAMEILDQAEDFANKRNMIPLRWLVILQRIDMLTRTDELHKADQVISANPQIEQFRTVKEQKEIGWREYQAATLVLSRFYFLTGKPRKALDLLSNPGSLGEPARRSPFQIASYALSSNILAELGKENDSLIALSEALKEAMKENLIRPIILEGARITPQLKHLIASSTSLDLTPTLIGFASDLIDQIEVKSQKPLGLFTQRESEILAEIKAGSPNKVIARELDISESTVKFHLANIYIKLGVKNRTQAVSAVQNMN